MTVSTAEATGAGGATAPETAATAVTTAAVVMAVDDRLPLFSRSEAQLQKLDNRNALVFAVPSRSSLLLKLVAPKSHGYEERDLRWLHLLQAIAVVPSRRVQTVTQLAQQALQLIPSPKFKLLLEQTVRGLVDVLTGTEAASLSFAARALLTIRLKDKVAAFLRTWVADPVEGFVLRKEHVVGGMCLDDLVATPVGAGYLRAYRRDDEFCAVLYPWGHGFVHLPQVEKLEEAIDHERKKRKHNEYLALEHQHLYEQVETLLENYPVENMEETADGALLDNFDVEEYKRLLESLHEEHVDPAVLDHDLNLLRRVQVLVMKLKKRRTHAVTGDKLAFELGGSERRLDTEVDAGDGDGDGDGDSEGDCGEQSDDLRSAADPSEAVGVDTSMTSHE